jgi:hypothetical protein
MRSKGLLTARPGKKTVYKPPVSSDAKLFSKTNSKRKSGVFIIATGLQFCG